MALILPRCPRSVLKSRQCLWTFVILFSRPGSHPTPSHLWGMQSLASNNVTEVKPAGHLPQLFLQPKSMWGTGPVSLLKAAELIGQTVNTRVLNGRTQWQQAGISLPGHSEPGFWHCRWLTRAKPSLLHSSVGFFLKVFLAGS